MERKRRRLNNFNFEGLLSDGSLVKKNSSDGDVLRGSLLCCRCKKPIGKSLPPTKPTRESTRIVTCSNCQEKVKNAAVNQILSIMMNKDMDAEGCKEESRVILDQSKCEGCILLTTLREYFDSHPFPKKLGVKKTDEEFDCKICAARIAGWLNFVTHMKTHLSKTYIRCKKCDRISHDTAGWSPEWNYKFVKDYFSKPCLWDLDDPDFENENARDKALQELVDTMNIADFTVSHARKKIFEIRLKYQEEVKTISNSSNKEYKSKHIWFPMADYFLRNNSSNKKKVVRKDFPSPTDVNKLKSKSEKDEDIPGPSTSSGPVKAAQKDSTATADHITNHIHPKSFEEFITSELDKLSPENALDAKKSIIKIFTNFETPSLPIYLFLSKSGKK